MGCIPLQSNAQKTEGLVDSISSKEIISETVKVISFNLTNNNHVLEKSLASATIISPGGLLLTNNHVVTDENDEPYETFAICVVVDEKEKPECLYTASLIAKDKSLDIALLQINPTDIYSNDSPQFPYLDYELKTLPPVEESITLTGFPGVGGETMTITEGQVSGYDEKEGFKQIKTDAVISPGNSGGTAKDSTGRFIGVPSYLRSYFGTIGYVVPLTEILPWLQGVIQETPTLNGFAIELLNKHLQALYETDQNKKYVSTIFPFYEIEVLDPWKTKFINDTNLLLENTVQGYTIRVNFSADIGSYEKDDDYMDFLLKKIEKNQHVFTNYLREEASFDGTEGFLISYDSGMSRNFYFLAPIENVLFSYSYSISLENPEETQSAVETLFGSFHFLKKENNTTRGAKKYEQSHPSVHLETFDPFFISTLYDSQLERDIVHIENPDSFEQKFDILRDYLPKDYWDLNRDEIMEKELKYIGSRLLNQYDDIVIDGLEGYAYTVSYKGDDFEQTRKKTVVKVFQDKKRFFEFVYDDLQEEYDKNISVFRETLENFRFDGSENIATKGEYVIPQFSLVYRDTKYHLYEKEINALASKDILRFKTHNFFPEIRMGRKDALEAIFEGKEFVEEGRNLFDTRDGIANASKEQIFIDTNEPEFNKILNYAVEKNILTKKPIFRVKEGITLAEALTILCRVYELPVWNPPYTEHFQWYVPYMYRGQLLGVIPEGLEHDSVMKRGQFAALLYDFIRIAGERSDL